MPHQCAHWFAMTCRNMRRVSIGNHAFPGQIRSAFHIRPKDCFSVCAAAGERIATPVCALVRNDMQKHAARLRVQGRNDMQKHAARLRVQGRNDMQKLAGCLRVQERAAMANLQLFRICLKCYVLFCAAAGERIATPVCALVRNDMQKHAARLRVQGRNDMQ